MKRALLLSIVLAAGCGRTPDPEPVGETTAPLTWAPHQELVGGDTVLVDGGTAWVTANDMIHVYDLIGGTWIEQQVLDIDGFLLRDDMAVSGDTLLVGTTNDPWTFDRVGGTWTQAQLLFPLQGNPARGLDIDGDTAILGTPTANSFNGAFRVWDRSGGTWSETQVIQATTQQAMGSAVAIEGDRALIGLPYANTFRGAVAYYTRTGGVWSEQQIFVPSTPISSDTRFGSAISMDGDRAVIGGEGVVFPTGTVLGVGRAFVFELQGDSWVEVDELVAPNVLDSDKFGVSVALSGDVAIVGAERHAAVSTLLTGGAFVFTRDGDTWSYTATLTGSMPMSEGFTGASVSIDGHVGIVSSIAASYVYTLAGGTCSAPSDCGVGSCVDGVCCNAACDDPCNRCDIAGEEGVCTVVDHGNPGDPSCGAYVCDGQSATCPTQCVYDSDCAAGHHCPSGPTPGPCVPLAENGTACATDLACASGVCVDGLCCDSECAGACASCTVAGSEGICSPLPARTPTTCAPYVCDGESKLCPERCETDAACPDGTQCDPNSGSCTDAAVCVDGHFLQQLDDRLDCEPYRCASDACLDSCTTSAACVPPFVCGPQGTCVAPPDRPTEVGGCSVGSNTASPHLWMILSLMLWRRRKES